MKTLLLPTLLLALSASLTHALTPAEAEAVVRADEVPVTFLQHLCDDHGGRLSGSPANEAAMSALEAELRAMGLEPERDVFSMPGWERGDDVVKLVAPVERTLRVAGLGYMEPSAAITAPVRPRLPTTTRRMVFWRPTRCITWRVKGCAGSALSSTMKRSARSL